LNAISIAEAYFSKEAWLRAIYADETPVGFVMLWENESNGEYFLWRFMIDEKSQKQGYGTRALELIIQHVRERQNAKALHLSYHEDEGSPRKFCETFGFVDTREQTDNGEYVMKLKLSA
jgi:diamine N-acetyltransferase